MSVKSPLRQRLNEYFLEIQLTKKKHIVVEGRTDQRFFRAWLDDIGGSAVEVAVTCVESLDVPVGEILSLGLTEGQRGRVVVVGAKSSNEGVDIRCVADRDCGTDVNDHEYTNLVWTDYPAIESYVVERGALDKANLLSFGGVLPDGDELLEGLSFALGELFAVRRRHPSLSRPNYKAGLPKRSKLHDFDVKRAVDVSLRPLVDGYERPSDSDPRHYAYGHDVGELLLAAYGNEIQNKAGLRTLMAVEGALRSAIHASRVFACEPMFVALKRWIEQ